MRHQKLGSFISGRNLALLGGLAFCAVRAYIYMPLGTEYSSRSIDNISGGQSLLLWVWIAAWVLAAVLCLVDMIRQSTLWGLSLMSGLTMAWGVGYFLTWCQNGLTGPEGLAAVTLIGPSMVILGLMARSTKNPMEAPDGRG